MLKSWLKFRTALALSAGLLALHAEAADSLRVLVYASHGGGAAPRDQLMKSLLKMSHEEPLAVVTTTKTDLFSRGGLSKFNVVLLFGGGRLSFSKPRQQDLESYVRGGGGLLVLQRAGTFSGNFPFLRKAMGGEYASGGGVYPASVLANPNASQAQEYARVFEDLPSSVVLSENWIEFRKDSEEVDGTVLFSRQGPGDSPAPLVWTRRIEKGVFVYSSLGQRNTYAQADGFGQKLLRNLIHFAAADSTHPPLAKGSTDVSEIQLSVAGKNVFFQCPAGRYHLKVLDSQGRIQRSESFEGPGTFRTNLPGQSGNYWIQVNGPGGSIARKVAVR